MSGKDKRLQPIIVKRVKKGGHGHHGGAWKIAYADFVTAMMAFFLLMWLLGSTTQGDLQGIADHFRTPLKVALMGGSGAGDASSIIKGGGRDLTRTTGVERQGEIPSPERKINLQALRAELDKVDAERLSRLKAQIEDLILRSPRLDEFRAQIRIDLVRDGLRIQIVDAQNRPMFDSGGAVVKDYMRDLLREIGHALNGVPNKITLTGHTDAAPYSSGERGYSNWELSADRANASRRELVAGGMDESKVMQVVGVGPSVLLDPDRPRNPVNRRISITVMKKTAEDDLLEGIGPRAGNAAELERNLDIRPPAIGIELPSPGRAATN